MGTGWDLTLSLESLPPTTFTTRECATLSRLSQNSPVCSLVGKWKSQHGNRDMRTCWEREKTSTVWTPPNCPIARNWESQHGNHKMETLRDFNPVSGFSILLTHVEMEIARWESQDGNGVGLQPSLWTLSTDNIHNERMCDTPPQFATVCIYACDVYAGNVQLQIK